MSLPVNGKTVEIRLNVFRARIYLHSTRIYS